MKELRNCGLLAGVALVLLTLAYQLRPPMQIAVGERTADPFVQGFSFRENGPFGAFRWSGAEASLSFGGTGSQGGVLSVRLASALGQVSLWANGHLLTPQPIGSGELTTYAFPIDREWLAPWGTLILTLQGKSFTVPPDTRELGVQVESASFTPLGGLVFPAPVTLLYSLLAAAVCYAIVRAWSGSAAIAQVLGAAVVIACAWGLAVARLEAAWLIKVTFWLGLAALCIGLSAAWLLRRFYPLDSRILRLVGALCLVALAVRVPFAVKPGLIQDVQDYVVWSYKLTHYGLGSTYRFTEGLWNPDYPPVLLYAFHGIGQVYQALFCPDFLYPVSAGDPAMRAVTTHPALLADPIHRTLLRMPAILADLLTGSLVYALARKRTTATRALVIASAYWFNPLVIYNSAVWGQTDAVYALFVVLAFALVELERPGWALFALVTGGLTKPQAFVFGPLLLLAAVLRQRWRGFWLACVGTAASLAVVMTPLAVAGALPDMLARSIEWARLPPLVSLSAHNLWWFVMRGDVAMQDSLFAIGGVSYRTLGLGLFAAAYALAALRLVRHPAQDQWPLAAYVGFSFFCLVTGVHENYAFTALALLAVAIAGNVHRTARVAAYTILTLTSLANYALHDPDLFARLALSAPDTQLLNARWANSAVNILLFAAWTIWCVLDLRRAPRADDPAQQLTRGHCPQGIRPEVESENGRIPNCSVVPELPHGRRHCVTIDLDGNPPSC